MELVVSLLLALVVVAVVYVVINMLPLPIQVKQIAYVVLVIGFILYILKLFGIYNGLGL